MRKRLSEPEARVGPWRPGLGMTDGASLLTWQLAAINATASGQGPLRAFLALETEKR